MDKAVNFTQDMELVLAERERKHNMEWIQPRKEIQIDTQINYIESLFKKKKKMLLKVGITERITCNTSFQDHLSTRY